MTRSTPAYPHRRSRIGATTTTQQQRSPPPSTTTAATTAPSSFHLHAHPSLPTRAQNPSPRAAMVTELRIRSIFLSSESKSGNFRKVSLLLPISSACVKGPDQGEAAAAAGSSSSPL
ncbi:hypothetical protein VPH35_093181 [Triticum aestivum]